MADFARPPSTCGKFVSYCRENQSALAWLVVFCVTGIMLGMCYELLDIHAGPAKDETFLTCFIGYWSQFLVGGLWVLRKGTWRQGKWTGAMVLALLASAVCDGAAQGLDFIAYQEAGFMLFTIFHSSVTLPSAIIAVVLLKAKVTWVQWAGVLLVVVGLLVTVFPNPVKPKNSFLWGFTTSAVGSLCLAASYPFSELVFQLGASHRPAEEMACFLGSVFNVVIFSVWTAVYTVPRWNEAVYEPIINDKFYPSVPWAWASYLLYGLMVGLHSLSFWKSVYKLGTVPTAVSKGAQQAGCFIFAHIFFCHIDDKECIDNNNGSGLWSRMQKGVACLMCCLGVVVYALGKSRASPVADGEKQGLGQVPLVA
mmetsp:Transcript_57317/g.125545  ORF Transcript_57317/g.125545 Transcript_57317/m.125545 type:complete len:367 (+) Transcript_57317:28-1128(+)